MGAGGSSQFIKPLPYLNISISMYTWEVLWPFHSKTCVMWIGFIGWKRKPSQEKPIDLKECPFWPMEYVFLSSQIIKLVWKN